MSQPSTHITMYPPASLGYPQFIAPFGDVSGRRAAVRVFFGDKKARHITTASDFEARLSRWNILQTYAPPSILSRPTFRPSAVDLDPQVDDLKRSGSSLDVPLHFLLTALSAAEFVAQDDDAPPPSFRAKVGSIWSSALPHDDGLCDEILVAQFERFVDHCTIDVSGRRNLFFVPTCYRDLIEARAIALHDELDMLIHAFDDTLAHLRPIFFHSGGQSTNHVLFFEPGTASLNVLLEVFSSCWVEAIERPTTSSTGHSGRHERELVAGMILGDRYEITSRIGSGGFAIVYEANDTKVSRQVAIKVIDLERNIEERSRQSYIKRFEREARLAVSVHHPCVVEVFDLGVTSEDVPYIVMERLEGWDLDAQSHHHGPMKPKRIIPMFIQALEGLGCAHEKNIVHKDLKPSNIFLKNPGKRHEQLCILDFGVARRINTTTARLTQTDSAFGTPHYMAPEYSTSQIATPALDVYQMGLILVEMLMGEPVVSHPEPVAAMFQHVRGDLSIPEALLDSPLGEVLRCALSTNHMLRYQDGFEFADALRKITDLSQIPVLEKGAGRISLNVSSFADPDSEVRETPVMGASLLTTDRYRSSKNVSIPRHELAAQPHLHLEPARVPEISPFASTLPFDDLPEQLAELHTRDEPLSVSFSGESIYAPPLFMTKNPEEAIQTTLERAREEGEEDGAEIVDYSSKKPYVLLISLLVIALLITTVALLRNKRELQSLASTPNAQPEVITEYDRKLAELRERARGLDAMLERGDIEPLIEEVALMDALDVRLTPDEVERVKDLLERARKERVNRAILDRALQLVKDREHERALDKLDTISPRSVFWDHADTRKILDSAKTALLPQVQRDRDNGHPERARRLVEKLILHDPQNTELTYLMMDIINDIASQPPAMLPLDKDMQGTLSDDVNVSDMGADARPDQSL